MFAIIARGRGTVLAQVLQLQPTFVSFEYGANEVLGPATNGSGTPLVTPVQFGALYAGTLDALLAARPGVKLALFTVPDVTTIPYVNYFKPDSLDASGNRVRLLGPVDADHPDGKLLPTDHVLLNAATTLAGGNGFPIGTVSYVSGYPAPGCRSPARWCSRPVRRPRSAPRSTDTTPSSSPRPRRAAPRWWT